MTEPNNFDLIYSYEKFFGKSHTYWHKRYKTYIGTNKVHALVELEKSGTLAQKDLAQRLWVTPGAITGLADDLEKKGLVEKHYSAQDKRTVQLTITEKGKKELKQTLDTAKIYVEEICQVLSPTEKELLFTINQKLCCHLDTLLQHEASATK